MIALGCVLAVIFLILILLALGYPDFFQQINPIAVISLALFSVLALLYNFQQDYLKILQEDRIGLQKERERLVIFLKIIGVNLELGIKHDLLKCEVAQTVDSNLINAQIVQQCERLNFALIRHNALADRIARIQSSAGKNKMFGESDERFIEEAKEYFDDAFYECIKILTYLSIHLGKHEENRKKIKRAFWSMTEIEDMRKLSIRETDKVFQNTLRETTDYVNKAIINDKFSGIPR